MIQVSDKDVIKSYDEMSKFADPDTDTILEECEFLKWCNENQEKVDENNWYKMLSITSRLRDGENLSHAMSENHPGYNEKECQDKIEQALMASGPRKCSNINQTFDKCKDCKHYLKVNSPIQITGPDYIKTEKTGFYEVAYKLVNGDRFPTRGKPSYDDLRKFFEKEHAYRSTDSGMVYTWNSDGYWTYLTDLRIESFAETHFNPKPTSNMVSEFRRKVQRTNLVQQEWFTESTSRKINLQNGVLDLSKENPELSNHTTDFGFTSVLPYEYMVSEFRRKVQRTNLVQQEWFTESTSRKINLQNGVLDLSKENPELSNHTTDFGFTSVLPYEYNPDADCPRFEQFLDEVTLGRDELKDVLMEYAGYAFASSRCDFSKALILTGEGANGKSTFINVLKLLAGRSAYSSLSLMDLQSERTRS